MGFALSTEAAMVPKIDEHFARKGWKVSREVRLRGRVADIVATKSKETAVVEIKGSIGDARLGLEQALHYGHGANFAYLAVPIEKGDRGLVSACRNLGVGLVLVDGGVREMVKPVRREALASVQRAILHMKPKEGGMVVKSPLEKLFRSRAQIFILRLFFLNPLGEFHLNDIARKTGPAPSVVAKECAVLLSLGLVKKSVRGNLTIYQINREGVIHDELKRIFMKYEFLDEMLSSKLRTEQVRYALIYGSFAKGTEGGRSDVDLLVVGSIEEDFLSKAVKEVERKTGREVNYTLWREKEFAEKVRSQIPLVRELSKTLVMMIISEESEFKRAIRERHD